MVLMDNRYCIFVRKAYCELAHIYRALARHLQCLALSHRSVPSRLQAGEVLSAPAPACSLSVVASYVLAATLSLPASAPSTGSLGRRC